MRISVLGLNHRTASIELREKVAFLPEEAREALDRFRESKLVSEMAIVSTCNRTEIYTVAEDPDAATAAVIDLVRERKGVDLSDASIRYRHEQQACVEHLFRVAGGIDSMVIGETGILGQVKEAFELASRRDTVGTYFGKLFPVAFRVGKRARSETAIGRGAGSLAKAGIQLARRVFGDLSNRNALVIGAGETGAHVASLLRDNGIRSLVVANRTVERAEEVAEREGGRAVSLDEADEEVCSAHIVVSAIHTTRPILGTGQVCRAVAGGRGTPLLVLDLGVPRNVDSTVGAIENVFLYAVDDLQELVNKNVGKRENAVPEVERIVAEEAERFWEWRGSLAAKPVVVAMRQEIDRIRLETLEKFGKSLDETERKTLEKFSMGLMNKILHQPTVGVRECDPSTPLGRDRLDWTRQLFGLDDPALANGDLSDDRRDKE
jgi:glutamyl-tRNA reductase